MRTSKEFNSILNHQISRNLVIEEYLEGPSYSIEVIGIAGNYQVFQITELEMDGDYDCKRVLAPVELGDQLIREFEKITLKLASDLSLNGIMDVETILQNGKLKVLEIDARLPSQTPTAVYYSTGVNMVE
nr:ATP-grasp domain-containing protein [Desulfosporosinus sp. FKB]